MFPKRSYSPCLKIQVPSFFSLGRDTLANVLEYSGNSFTPWFKLIARDFLFGWWDELHKRRNSDGNLVASSLAGVADGSKVIKMT